MTTFKIGDRAKAVANIPSRSLKRGGIYLVIGCSDDFVSIDLDGEVAFNASLFELYAKAGEFVAGDKLVALNDFTDGIGQKRLTAGKIYDAVSAYSIAECDDGHLCHWERPEEYFRLATPEEISAAGAEIEESRAQSVVTQGVDPGAEIPAADFDFCTIKTGAEVVVVFKVASDGLDRDGEVRVESREGFFHYIRPASIRFIIPAPKPKTLRERAIEASLRVGLDNSSESREALVDAILAEVEKGAQ